MAQKFITPITIKQLASTGSDALTVFVDGEVYGRVRIEAGGRISWSDGAGSYDTNIYRSGANTLSTDDVFKAISGVVTLAVNGVPSAALPDGAIAVDTLNNAFYFRSNGTWTQVTGGGGATVTVSDTPPASPTEGDLWFESDTAKTHVYYDSFWVEIGASGGVATLDNIGDVTAPTPSNGDFLKWNGTAWVNDPINLGTDTVGNYVNDITAGTGISVTHTPGEGSSPTVALDATLDNLSNVTAPSPSDGQFLKYVTASAAWVPAAVPTINALDDVTDVTISSAVTYNIGDTGPAGGKIFITPSTAGNSTGLYFEAGPTTDYAGTFPSSEVQRSWSTGANQTSAVSGADGTAIGTGAQNTIDIVAQSGNVAATSAAVYCSDYTYGGFSDWFLPSKDELNQMYLNRVAIGFQNDNYYSSSENGTSNAWFQYFYSNIVNALSKANVMRVRPVRMFAAAAGVTSGDFLKWNGTAWVNDPINLGTDTVGNYVASLVAGTGVTLTNGTASEGGTPTVAIGQAVGTTSNVQFNDVTVDGNLTVNGTTTTLNTDTLSVEDNIIVLNSNITASPTLNAGIEIERGTSANVLIRWNETSDKWEFTNDGSTYVDLGGGGGGGGLTVSASAPASPTEGDMWFDSDTAKTYVYYDSYWVEVGNVGGTATVLVSSAAPASPTLGTLWFDSDTAQTFAYYDSQWIEVGASGMTAIVSDTAPTSPISGLIWFKSSTGQTFTYYDSFWIELGAQGVAAYVAETAPTSPVIGQIWFNSATGGSYVYFDSTWVEIGAQPLDTIVSTIDAKGDILVGIGDNSISKVSAGSDTFVLTANSATATGLQWVSRATVANDFEIASIMGVY